MSPERGSAIKSVVRKAGYLGAAMGLAAAGYFGGLMAKIESLASTEGSSGIVPKETSGEFGSKVPNGTELDLPKSGGSGGGFGEIVGRQLKPGEVFVAPAGSILMGDAFVGGERFFDDNASTAQITVINEDVEVKTPFGGSVLSGGDEAAMNEVLGRVTVETQMNGCASGCSAVDLVNWPGGRSVRGAAPDEIDHQMQPGETRRIRAGSIVKGDVVVNGRNNFDNDATTGAISELNEDADVLAPFGANVTLVGFDKATVDRLIGASVEEMKAKGCVDQQGCRIVEVFKVGQQPSLSEQPKKKHIPVPIVTPVATPIPAPKLK